jgi:ligand-binding SRPBCC domain-containing protein
MRPYTLDTRMLAPVSLHEAFAVFEDPYNLARITPPWLAFRVTSQARVTMRRGAEITYRIRWLGLPVSWRTVITEYNPPYSFVDEQAAGPYRLWRHRHTFQPGAHGTLVADHVDYILPWGFLGRLLHRLLVRRQLERIFAFRQRALAAIWTETMGRAAR